MADGVGIRKRDHHRRDHTGGRRGDHERLRAPAEPMGGERQGRQQHAAAEQAQEPDLEPGLPSVVDDADRAGAAIATTTVSTGSLRHAAPMNIRARDRHMTELRAPRRGYSRRSCREAHRGTSDRPREGQASL